METIKIDTLFEKVPALLSELFCNFSYPWEVMDELKAFIDKILEHPPKGYRLLKEGVLVGENVVIHPTATIIPPAIIGNNTEIRPNAFIRGYVFCGDNCVIGNATELKHCILMEHVQVPHYNYAGDSILGNYSHMGAGTICSNLKSDGTNVVIHAETDLQTNRRKLGGILGDRADVGCGCVLNPGCIIGKNTSVYPLTALRGVYPSNSIVKSTKEIVKRKK